MTMPIMLQDEIVTEVYKRIKNISVPVYKYFNSQKKGKKVIIQLISNNFQPPIFQVGEIAIIIIANTLDNMIDANTLNSIKNEIDTAIQTPVDYSFMDFQPSRIDGPDINPSKNSECYLVLKYKFKISL